MFMRDISNGPLSPQMSSQIYLPYGKTPVKTEKSASPQVTNENKKTSLIAKVIFRLLKALGEIFGRRTKTSPKKAKVVKGSPVVKAVAVKALPKVRKKEPLEKAQKKEPVRLEKSASERLEQMKKVPMGGLEKSIGAGKSAAAAVAKAKAEEAEKAAAAKFEADFQTRTIGVDSSSLPHDITDIEAAEAQKAEEAQKAAEAAKAAEEAQKAKEASAMSTILSFIKAFSASKKIEDYMFDSGVSRLIASSLPEIRAASYTDDGKLKNMWGAHLSNEGICTIYDQSIAERSFFAIADERYPSNLEKQADNLKEEAGRLKEYAETLQGMTELRDENPEELLIEAQQKLEEAQQKLEEAAANQKEMIEGFTKMLTKYPVADLDKQKIRYTDVELDKDEIYYHGTGKDAGTAILNKNFNLDILGTRPLLDTARGAYLTPHKDYAAVFAVDDDVPKAGSIVKMKVNTKKIASLDSDWKTKLHDHCKMIVNMWSADHSKEIVESLKGFGKSEKDILSRYKFVLAQDLFTDYFKSKGYDGILTPNNLGSDKRPYLNIFEPKNVAPFDVIKP